ncbi:MAG: nucleoside hydrolase [Clostridia bacterium]|nr:nucleoside hydrolase [Clostridia bacterium]
MKNLIIFADYGLDDAAATVTLFKHHQKFETITIVPIGGNVPCSMSYNNCLTLLSHYKNIQNKLTVVDAQNIPQPSEYLSEIHGKDGMGDFFERTLPDFHPNVVSFDQWLTNIPRDSVILSLGPMTLVKKVMEIIPLPLVLMGGCINETPNFKGYEFNHCLDTDAFSFCTAFPHTAITLDTCRVKALDMRQREITGDDLHSAILRADCRLSISRKEDGCYVWDDIAAAYLVFPERFSVEKACDLHGNTLYNAKYISDKLYFED